MEISAARSCFPGTQGQVFLDAACVGLLPVQAEAALRRLGQELLFCPARDASAHHIALDQTADRPRREAYWVPARWEQRGNSWIYIEGHWA